MRYHQYADDTHRYISSGSELSSAAIVLSWCQEAAEVWMESNRLNWTLERWNDFEFRDPWILENYHCWSWKGLHHPSWTWCVTRGFSWIHNSCFSSWYLWPGGLLPNCESCANYAHSWSNVPFSQSPTPWSSPVRTIAMHGDVLEEHLQVSVGSKCNGPVLHKTWYVHVTSFVGTAMVADLQFKVLVITFKEF